MVSCSLRASGIRLSANVSDAASRLSFFAGWGSHTSVPAGRTVDRIVARIRRGLLRGIAHYIKANGAWSVQLQERDLGDSPPDWLHGWRGDGIIARVETESIERAILERGYRRSTCAGVGG